MTAGLDPVAADWPVLVTGAGGFLGGHVARDLAAAGHRVRALTRRPPSVRPGDPAIEWVVGDVRDASDRRRAVAGVRGVIHSAGWVSLASDPKGHALATNLEATRGLLGDAAAAGVGRFVFTSTLHTLAAGTAESPADEETPWNLGRADSPYCRSKRRAEAVVLGEAPAGVSTVVLCPGLTLGPRDPRPTSTALLLAMARAPVAFMPDGGTPVVDAAVVATAHRRALTRGEPGRRYAVVGPYLSYPEIAALVRSLAGRPRRVVRLPGWAGPPTAAVAAMVDAAARGRWISVSRATVGGGFLRIHVRGARGDAAFGLSHPDPLGSVRAALVDARDSGLAPWLRLREPSGPA